MEIISSDKIPIQFEEIPNDLMELYKVCKKMQTLCNVQKGIGLSAFQVGIPWRLFVINTQYTPYEKEGYRFCIDCEYEGIEDKDNSIESCLSLRYPDDSFKQYLVQRYKKVKVTGKELIDDGTKLVLKDFVEELNILDDKIYCAVYQHEIDHHNSILISDIGELTHIFGR